MALSLSPDNGIHFLPLSLLFPIYLSLFSIFLSLYSSTPPPLPSSHLSLFLSLSLSVHLLDQTWLCIIGFSWPIRGLCSVTAVTVSAIVGHGGCSELMMCVTGASGIFHSIWHHSLDIILESPLPADITGWSYSDRMWQQNSILYSCYRKPCQ